ncbi:MAG: hypothetical protein R2748_25140 [Bryobacterales bacterium]
MPAPANYPALLGQRRADDRALESAGLDQGFDLSGDRSAQDGVDLLQENGPPESPIHALHLLARFVRRCSPRFGGNYEHLASSGHAASSRQTTLVRSPAVANAAPASHAPVKSSANIPQCDFIGLWATIYGNA